MTTLAEQLQELDARYAAPDGLAFTQIGQYVRAMVGRMDYGDTKAFHLRDQYGLTGMLWLYMAHDGKLEWALTGQIKDALEAMR